MPCFLAAVLKNPRTECGCQPAAAIKSRSVAPFVIMLRMTALLDPSRVWLAGLAASFFGAALAFLAALGVRLAVLVSVVALVPTGAPWATRSATGANR